MYVYIYIYVTVGEDSVVVQASGERCSTYTCMDVYIYDNIYIYILPFEAIRGLGGSTWTVSCSIWKHITCIVGAK